MVDYMQIALELAQKAAGLGEVPVGAVIVRDDKIVAIGYNRREIDHSAVAHAELIAIQAACEKLGSWRLENCQLFVTLEPCPMCAGAIVNSRIPKVVFGASDPKAGCFGSMMNFNDYSFNHKPEIVGGVLAEESATLLRDFFRQLRK